MRAKFNRGARNGTKVRRAAKSGTGLRFNEDVLLIEELRPRPGFRELDRQGAGLLLATAVSRVNYQGN